MTFEDTANHSGDESTKSASMADQRRTSLGGSASSNLKNKRKPTSLPHETVEYLKNWMMSPEHIAHPYPTEQEKAQIMKDTGIELKQLTNWFVNNRKRYWKPRVEARLQQQAKAQRPPSVVPASTPLGNPKNPVLVTPNRRQALVHVVSTPNVTTLNVDDNVGREAIVDGGGYGVVNESSCSSSENGSVGMNIDQDDSSTGQTTNGSIVGKENAEGRPTSVSVSSEAETAGVDVAECSKPKEHSDSFDGSENSYSIASVKDDYLSCTEADRLEDYHFNILKENDVSPSKRKATCTAQEAIAPRPKYRRKSIEVWKRACADASHGYCATLPTLDEAARLFGFA
ncbi:hypothetical protein ACA910_012489 [Epithemia clementina (nom. ined.)]